MWRSDPGWFVIFHELGHNFTLAAARFNQLYPGLGYISVGGDYWSFGTNFGEAWASMVGLYAMRELFTESGQYQLSGDCAGNLEQVFNGMKSSFIGKLHNYEGSPDFSTLYPDLLDGIFLALADSFGYDIIPRWFKILQPPNAPWSQLNTINPSTDYNSSKITAMTITACAFSVAAKVELRDLFRTRWDFPINDVLYNQIKPEIDQMINGSTLVEDSHAGPSQGFRTLGNYPNPFNGITRICFQLSKESSVRIRLYNMIGQLVRDSPIGDMQPGNHEISYDVSQLSSGVYYYVLMTAQGNLNNRLIITR